MPTYTYLCTKCGLETEVVQSMTDPPLKRCPKCKGALRRTYHPVGIVLKGAGFHRNDYRSNRPSDAGKKDEPKTDTKTETNTDSKPAETKKETGGSGGSAERSGATPRSKDSSSSTSSDD